MTPFSNEARAIRTNQRVSFLHLSKGQFFVQHKIKNSLIPFLIIVLADLVHSNFDYTTRAWTSLTLEPQPAFAIISTLNLQADSIHSTPTSMALTTFSKANLSLEPVIQRYVETAGLTEEEWYL
jgi:hypothetical protein